jgi:small multidrug resistance family-3 protein
MVKTMVLYALTALMELLGCYLPYLWLRQGRSALLLIPAALCLGLFAWLLSLHPAASGRVSAAYGAVYVSMALLWLRLVDGVVPTGRDLLGVLISGGPPRP